VASLQHVQNVQCTPKKVNFGFILCSLKHFFSKNTLALIDFLFLHTQKFYSNDATAYHDRLFSYHYPTVHHYIEQSNNVTDSSGGLRWGQKGSLPPLFFFALFKILKLFKNLLQIINMFSSGVATAGHLW
jgi:hypothetical protein